VAESDTPESPQEGHAAWRRYDTGRDWVPDYMRRCAVCGGEDDVLAVTEWTRGLCPRCLPRAVENRLFSELRRRQMVLTRDKVGVAVSGGKDSAALLAILATLRRRKPFTLVAIHVDMGLGEYSRLSREAVEAVCRRYAVRLVVETAEEHGIRAEATGPWPVCAVCGAVRRAVFPRAARREKLDALATGHTLEDMLQALLKQIMSGKSYCPKSVLPATAYDPRKIKPLYFVPEKVTAAYAQARGLEYVAETCPHFPPDTHRFKDVFEHLEALAPMAKVQVLTNLGKLMAAPAAGERPYQCEDCGETSKRQLCPLCMLRRLQRGETG
jgi:uncharacterized protein (TIGR00269 family)